MEMKRSQAVGEWGLCGGSLPTEAEINATQYALSHRRKNLSPKSKSAFR
jgi:hypothetical protein